MVRRFAAFVMVLVLSGQALAGGIMCGVEAISDALHAMDEMACPMEDAGECDDMACCALGQAPTGAMAAMLCCEVKCGESTSGAQFDLTPPVFIPAANVVTIRLVSLEGLGEIAAAQSLVSARTAETHFLHHYPPDLFLSHSTFLI
jgi:CheY-specific phosphatase CheX